MLRTIVIMLAALLCMAECDRKATKGGGAGEAFIVETINKTTPVKNQGRSPLCWIYAMLATIESDRLMIGDSVNLSPDYVARMMLRSETLDSYTSGGQDSISLRATAPLLLRLLDEFGAMPYDSYHSERNYQVLTRRLNRLAAQCVSSKAGIARLLEKADDMMDNGINPVPWHVYMFGAEYTPVEFAHSVCLPGEYRAYTSFTHEPFQEDVRLNVPDNRSGERFRNIPIDSLVNLVVRTLRSGRSVCWEGDITEPGFSFSEGTARLGSHETYLSQEARQRMFESFSTTDDHCMELIGLARDRAGHRYFVCKNSWGTGNPYHGLMFMSVDYARMKTIAVVMKSVD